MSDMHEKFTDGNGLVWELVGTIGVDSGGIVITDPCYVKEMFLDWDKHCEDYSVWSDGHKKRTCQDPQKSMLFSSAGFGDGEYAVYARFFDEGDWDNRVAELRVVFIEEPGLHCIDENDEECEDDESEEEDE